jgi:hypothetical protein
MNVFSHHSVRLHLLRRFYQILYLAARNSQSGGIVSDHDFIPSNDGRASSSIHDQRVRAGGWRLRNFESAWRI